MPEWALGRVPPHEHGERDNWSATTTIGPPVRVDRRSRLRDDGSRGAPRRPWSVLTSAPMDADGDVWLYLTYVRNILAGNLNGTNRLGVPFGQHLLDYPVGNDFTHFLLVRVVGSFTSNDFLVMNITFLAGFGLVAAATKLVPREAGTAQGPVGRGRGALHLRPVPTSPKGSTISSTPATGQCRSARCSRFWTLRGTLPLPRIVVPRGAWDHGQSRRLAILVACVLVGGTSDPYFTFFTLFLVVTAALLASWRDRTWSRGLAGAVVAGGLATVLLAYVGARHPLEGVRPCKPPGGRPLPRRGRDLRPALLPTRAARCPANSLARARCDRFADFSTFLDLEKRGPTWASGR